MLIEGETFAAEAKLSEADTSCCLSLAAGCEVRFVTVTEMTQHGASGAELHN